MTYTVLTATIAGWEDCWTVSTIDPEKGWVTVPDRYETAAEAQAEIDEIFEEYAQQVKDGTREADEVPDRDEYLIIPTKDAQSATQQEKRINP